MGAFQCSWGLVTRDVTTAQELFVTLGVTTCDSENAMLIPMKERKFAKTYIREWREFRGLSLRRLADRLEMEGPDDSFSHASIGRIETGLQPYTQPVLEALAEALNVSVVDLLSVDPTKEGEVVDLMRLLDDKNRDQAIRVLKAMTGG